ncbi:MAG: hypothetical protein IJU75_06575 [Clostridia bacterium]|nr:hypothetical protein [Clostridia bacterium]
MKKMIAVLLAALCVLAVCACNQGSKPAGDTTDGVAATTEAQTAAPVTMPDNIAKVIIIAGQSNAVGYSYRHFLDVNYLDQYSRERLAAADAGYPDVLMKYSNNPYDPAQDTCGNEDFEAVHFGMGARNNDYKEEWGLPFGPEMGIAERLTEKYPGDKFYIVKCATSGANLSNRWNPMNKNLYTQMVNFTSEALAGLKAQGLKPEIICFCWMQGESDAQENYVPSYTSTFNRLLKQFCEDLAEYMPPNGMSVADAGIRAVWPNYEEMNAAKEKFANKSSKRYFFDTTWFIAGRDHYDRAHYDAYSMIQLGNAFGDCIVSAIEDYGNPEVTKK